MNYWVDGKMHLAWTAQWSWPCWEGQRWENPRTWEWETSPTTHAIRQRGLGKDASSNASGRWESWGPKSGRAAPALAEILRRTGPVPHLCSTREPALLAEVWMSQPRTCEHERTVPITYLSCAGVGGREIPPLITHTSLSVTDEGTNPPPYRRQAPFIACTVPQKWPCWQRNALVNNSEWVRVRCLATPHSSAMW